MRTYPLIMSMLSVLFCCNLGCASYQEQFHVRVDAGASDRIGTPVFIDVRLPAFDANMTAAVEVDGQVHAAQIENLGNAMVRIWWIIDSLPAGTSGNYMIRIGDQAEAPFFQWHDTMDKYSELMLGGRSVLRYQYDRYDPERLDETRNPYHHIFSPDGAEIISKGPGGLHPHHRGIFFAYSKVMAGDSTYNIWAAGQGDHSSHAELLRAEAGQIFGSHSVSINWYTRHGSRLLTEIRTVRAFSQPDGFVLLDWQSDLKALSDPINLSGDRQHAGVQFRASNVVAEHPDGTTFLRPSQWADLPNDKEINDAGHRDLPWNAMQFNLDTNAYTVAYLSDPGNPEGADFSERRYGRFGEYFPWQLTVDNPLNVQYRFWVTANRNVHRETIEQRYLDLAAPPEVTRIK